VFLKFDLKDDNPSRLNILVYF